MEIDNNDGLISIPMSTWFKTIIKQINNIISLNKQHKIKNIQK